MSARPSRERGMHLAVLLARVAPAAGPAQIGRAVQALQRAALLHKAAGEFRCSTPLTEDQDRRLARREERVATRACAALLELGLNGAVRAEFGGDCRGSCDRLHIEGTPGDGWGADGWPIY